MSNSNNPLYIGSYSDAAAPGLSEYSFDAATGALTRVAELSGIPNPSFLALHPNGHWLYAVGETSVGEGAVGTIWAVEVSRDPSSLLIKNNESTDGDWPCHVAIDGGGRWLVMTNYGTGSFQVRAINDDGSVGEMSDFVQHYGSGPNPERQPSAHAHSSIFSADNRYLFVADLGIDAVVVYTFDANSGKVEQIGEAKARPGAGPRHMAWHPILPILYVANELNSTVVAYEYDGEGGLKELQETPTLVEANPGNWVSDIHISPNAERLYVANRGDNSIAIFAVDAAGHLERIAISSCGGDWPRNFAIAPGDRFILIANQNSGDVSVLPRQAGPEGLGAAVEKVAIPGASCIVFVPTS